MEEHKPFMDQLAEAHAEVVNAVLKPVKEAWREMLEERPWEAFMHFINAVDWQEPWIIVLLSAQALLFLSALAFRRSTTYLGALFCFGATVVYFGERINAFGAAHWQRFATQAYFDSNGAFFSAVVAGPMMLTLFTVLILYLLQVVAMMAEVKRAQLQHSAAQQRHGAGAGRQQEAKKVK